MSAGVHTQKENILAWTRGSHTASHVIKRTEQNIDAGTKQACHASTTRPRVDHAAWKTRHHAQANTDTVNQTVMHTLILTHFHLVSNDVKAISIYVEYIQRERIRSNTLFDEAALVLCALLQLYPKDTPLKILH